MRELGSYKEERSGRKTRKARQRLERRIAGWEDVQKQSKTHHTAGYRKPGSLQCK